jgi:hypothetical protein
VKRLRVTVGREHWSVYPAYSLLSNFADRGCHKDREELTQSLGQPQGRIKKREGISWDYSIGDLGKKLKKLLPTQTYLTKKD